MDSLKGEPTRQSRAQASSADVTAGADTACGATGRSAMELSSMPLDPIYAWGIVLEPVEVMIERTSRFVEALAREQWRRGESFSDDELEERFLRFFDRLVEEGTLERLADAPPEMGRRILGPGRWLEAQRIRMRQLIACWRGEDRRSD